MTPRQTLSAPGGDTVVARGLHGAPLWLLVALIALALLFLLLPQLDLAISGLFAGAGGFPLQLDPTIGRFNRAVLMVGRVGSGILLVLAILAWLPFMAARLRHWRHALLFLLLAAALGPGLLVNVVLKEWSGRARPVMVQEFGGPKRFTAALVLADQCERNCSFVSGHASIATMAMAGWFLARTRRRRRAWLWGGLAFALLAGVARIVVGAHFASDVLLAIGMTWLVITLCAAVILRPGRGPDAAPGGAGNSMQ